MKNAKVLLLSTLAVLLACILGIFTGRNLPDNRTSLLATPEQTILQTEQADGRININTATKQELMMLPGIGETLAERIIAYRRENGRFSVATDLQLVPGIGAKKMSDIFKYITVGD